MTTAEVAAAATNSFKSLDTRFFGLRNKEISVRMTSGETRRRSPREKKRGI
jgi:hypothetical protein